MYRLNWYKDDRKNKSILFSVLRGIDTSSSVIKIKKFDTLSEREPRMFCEHCSSYLIEFDGIVQCPKCGYIVSNQETLKLWRLLNEDRWNYITRETSHWIGGVYVFPNSFFIWSSFSFIAARTASLRVG